MTEAGMLIQSKALKLFSAFFTKEFLSPFIENLDESNSGLNCSQLISMLKTDAKMLQIPFEVHATQFAIQVLDYFVQSKATFSGPGTVFYDTLSFLVKEDKILLTDVRDKVINYPNVIPFHLAVHLDQSAVMSLIYYFERCSKSSVKTSELTKSIFELASNLSDENNHTLFHTILNSIVYLGYHPSPTEPKEINGQARKMSMTVLNDLTQKVWEVLLENPEKNLYTSVYEVPSPSSLYFHLASYQKCMLEQLSFLISYRPEVKATLAISSQHEWTYFKSPKYIVGLITQLLQPLDVEVVVAKLDEILTRYEINWKTLLLVVSTIQICSLKGHKALKTLVSSLVQRALDNLQKELLLASFLLARQINAENTNSSQYGVWFSSITSFSTPSKHFVFLMKFLTSIVRYEPLWVLVAHKNNPLTVPVVDNCRSLWMDYSTLIRTRIEDLKEKQPLEQIAEEDIALTKEVDSAVVAFGKSGKIPSVVIEAAIFRKPYFVGKFLPVLLKPRLIPEPPDIREEFVDELRRSGKLPIAQYEAYVTACKEMKCQNALSPESMDYETADERDSYRSLFAKMVVCKDTRELSLLQENFDSLLNKLLPASEQTLQDVQINLPLPDNEKDEAASKVMKCWIESLGNFFSSDHSFDGLKSSFLTIFRYPTLVKSLYDVLLRFILDCRSNLEEPEAQGYGAVICLLSVHWHLLIPVSYSDFKGTIIELLTNNKHFEINGEELMLNRLKLLYYTVIMAKQLDQLSRISLTSSLYLWICRRVLYSQKAHLHQKYLSPSLEENFVRENELSLQDWLRFEMVVAPEKDILSWSERSGYLHSVLKTTYHHLAVSEICSLIFDALITQMTRHSSARADGSTKDFLLLLQSISSTNNNQSSSSDSSAWLAKYCLQLRQEREKGNGVDQLLWSFICYLPPFLLVRNSSDQPISDTSVKILVSLVEDEWRNTITSGSAWLPKHVTNHLLLAFEELKSFPNAPCLQFSAKVHKLNSANSSSLGAWRILDRALDIFNPSIYDPALRTVQWSNVSEVNLLVNQLVALAATVCSVEGVSVSLPLFISQLGETVSQNPAFLKGWNISSWIGNDSFLPWRKILPSYFINLLPYVLTQVLITWSDSLIGRDLQTAIDFLAALMSSYNHWVETTHSFVDILTEKVDECSRSEYPVGKIMDLTSFSRLSRNIKEILNKTPIRTLKAFQQTSCFTSMESHFQMLVKQRCL